MFEICCILSKSYFLVIKQSIGEKTLKNQEILAICPINAKRDN